MKDSRNLKHLDDAANRVVVYYKDKWHKRDVPILKSFDHASWLSGVVFDGARYFNRTMPDIIAHMSRAIKSAKAVNLDPDITSDELVELAKEGVKFFLKIGHALGHRTNRRNDFLLVVFLEGFENIKNSSRIFNQIEVGSASLAPDELQSYMELAPQSRFYVHYGLGECSRV